MSYISLFGMSGAGKTCFIYAMSQVLSNGASGKDMEFTLKANSRLQQVNLDKGCLTLLNGSWPQPTNLPTYYDFTLRLQHQGYLLPIIPNLEIYDYRGGILESDSINDETEYKKLLKTFSDSIAVVYIIDAVRLYYALDDYEKRSSKFQYENSASQLASRQKIRIIENLISDYKKEHKDIPPVLIAISKADVLTQQELEAGKRFLMRNLPSLFSRGSNTHSAITHFSLGRNLMKGINRNNIDLTTKNNLHIPVLFGAYAELSKQFNEAPNDQVRKSIWDMLKEMRNIFRNRLDVYIDGLKAKEA